MKIDRNSPVAIYFQIKEDIESKIASNILKEGDKLPTEKELCKQYGVSRITIRRALQELENDDMVKSIQGKGAFVSSSSIKQDLTMFYSFSDEIIKRGFVPSSIFVQLSLETPSNVIKKALELDEDEKVYMLMRIRMADNHMIALDRSYFSEKRFKDFDKKYLANGSLYEAFDKYYGVKANTAVEEIESVPIPKEDAEIIGAKENSPYLLVKRISMANDLPIEYNYRLVNTKNYKYRIKLA